MIRIWLLLNYLERTAGPVPKRCIVATETPIPPRGLHNPFSPKMSSQAKVKKDKEIIAEYETQVKGW